MNPRSWPWPAGLWLLEPLEHRRDQRVTSRENLIITDTSCLKGKPFSCVSLNEPLPWVTSAEGPRTPGTKWLSGSQRESRQTQTRAGQEELVSKGKCNFELWGAWPVEDLLKGQSNFKTTALTSDISTLTHKTPTACWENHVTAAALTR